MEIIANSDSDDSSTGFEGGMLNSDINELEESVIGLPRQFKPIQLAEDTVIIVTKKATQSTDNDINKVCDLAELEVPPIPLDNEKKTMNNRQMLPHSFLLTMHCSYQRTLQ